MSGLIYHDGVLFTDRTCLERGTTGYEEFNVYTETSKIFKSKCGDLAIVKLGGVLRKPDDISVLESIARLSALALDTAVANGVKVMDGPTEHTQQVTTRRKADQLTRMQNTDLLRSTFVMTSSWFFYLGIKLEQPEKKVLPILKLTIQVIDPSSYYTNGSMDDLLVGLLQAGYTPEEAMKIALRHHVHSRDFGYDTLSHEDLSPMVT